MNRQTLTRPAWQRRWAGLSLAAIMFTLLAGLFHQDIATPQVAEAANLSVSNTNDSGLGSLRQAILDANSAGGTSTISFNLPAGSTITLATALPALSANGVIIGTKGTTSADSCKATSAGDRGQPQITLDAGNIGAGADALTVSSTGNTLQGLAFVGAPGAGLVLSGAGNTVGCSYFGLSANGTAKANGVGLKVTGGTNASPNVLGGSNPTDGNLITGNTGAGVSVATGAIVRSLGNLIYKNGGLGIDLNANNVPDLTPANGTAAPVLTSAVWDGARLQVKGTAQPGAVVEIFLTDTPSDANGEGQAYLATTTASGAGNFDTGNFTPASGTPTLSATSKITALATPLAGGTSEFAANIIVTVPPFTVVKVGRVSGGGARITWTVIISNRNTFDITNATLTDTSAPNMVLVPGSLTTSFLPVAAGNTATPGGFPAAGQALTFSLTAGSSLVINYDTTLAASVATPTATPTISGTVTPTATVTPTPSVPPTNPRLPYGVYTNLVTVKATNVNNGQPFNSNLAVVRFEPEEKEPADIVTSCKITPDREASDDEDNEIKIKCKVHNAGHGKAHDLRLLIPIDVTLEVGYAVFSDKRIWVSQIVLTGPKPYIIISLPDMESYDDDMNAQLVFRPKHGLDKALRGHKILLRAQALWDDAAALGNVGDSNGVVVILGEKNEDSSGGATIQFDNAQVTITINLQVTFTTTLYAPDEYVDFWITKPDHTSFGLPRGRAGHDGKIIYLVSTSGLAPGIYVFVGRGVRSDIQIVGIIIILAEGSGTPCASASPTAATTVAATVTPTTGPCGTPSVTPSVSPSASPCASPTVTSTATATPCGSPSPTAVGSVSAGPITPTAAASGSGSNSSQNLMGKPIVVPPDGIYVDLSGK